MYFEEIVVKDLNGLKGWKVSISFSPTATVIYGVNGTGKSSILKIMDWVVNQTYSLKDLAFGEITIRFSDGYAKTYTKDDVAQIDKLPEPEHRPSLVLSNPDARAMNFDTPFPVVTIGEAFEKITTNIITGYAPEWMDEFTKVVNEFFNYIGKYQHPQSRKQIVLAGDNCGMFIGEDEFRRDLGKYDLSAGERHMIAMLYTAYVAGEGSIVLIDEPERSLHIDAQRQLPLLLPKGRQYVVATHSPEIYSVFEHRVEGTATQELSCI